MKNANLVTKYKSWRLLPVHLIAKLFGVLIHIEGYPFGSNRIYLKNRREQGSSSQMQSNSFGTLNSGLKSATSCRCSANCPP